MAVALANVTDNEVLIRVRFTSDGPPMEVGLTALLDAVFGKDQGTICYRSRETWRGLFPGVSDGLVLTSGGPNANVYWSPGSGFLAPAFASFDIAGQATVIEVGATIAAGAKTFEWVTTNPSNVQANSLSIVDTTASSTLASGLADDGSEVITIGAITNTQQSSQVWTITGVSVQSISFSLSFQVDWQWRIYAGTDTHVTLTANQIKSLTDFSSLQAGFPGTYTFADAFGFKYFCYPDVLGDVVNFLDAVTGFPVSMADVTDNAAYFHTANGWSYALVSVTNTQGVATNYRVYRTENEFSGVFVMRVS